MEGEWKLLDCSAGSKLPCGPIVTVQPSGVGGAVGKSRLSTTENVREMAAFGAVISWLGPLEVRLMLEIVGIVVSGTNS